MKKYLRKLIPYNLIHFIRRTKCIIEAFLYRGDNFECPLCKKQFRKLKDGGESLPFFKDHKIVGGGRRKNMLCPFCLSTDRDRLIYFYLTTKKELQNTEFSLLHVSPEPSLKNYFSTLSNIKYHSGDKFEERYQGFYYDKTVSDIDLTNLQYPDEKFDIIICNHVLEHIKEESKALHEIKRVLKNSGWAILQVPIAKENENTIEYQMLSSEEKKNAYGQEDHERLYGLDYPDRLREHGFEVDTWCASDLLNANDIYKFALNNEEKVFITRKL
jgi:hypothetical protein